MEGTPAAAMAAPNHPNPTETGKGAFILFLSRFVLTVTDQRVQTYPGGHRRTGVIDECTQTLHIMSTQQSLTGRSI